MNKFLYYFLIFFIYSCIGYIVEVTCVSIKEKKLTFSRGFLIGPYLPIYGTGSIIITLLLTNYKDDLFALFILSFVICGIVEYLTSLIMETLFKLRWWDYTDKLFNVNGRICLSNLIGFGIGGVIIIKYSNPIIYQLLSKMSILSINIISIICFIIFISDFIISYNVITKLKFNVKKYARKDATFMVRRQVREVLSKYNILTTRLMKAFPDIKLNNPKDMVEDRIEDIKEIIKNSKLEYIENKKKRKEKIKKLNNKIEKLKKK